MAVKVSASLILVLTVVVCYPVLSQDAHSSGKSAKSSPLLREFSAWLRRHGVDDGNVRLVDEDERGWGKGIVARKSLKEGDLMFRIPLKWCLHSVAAKRNKFLAKPLSQHILPRGMAGEAIMVALLLMVEACKSGDRSETCKLREDGPSEFQPYIRSLPSNFSAEILKSHVHFTENIYALAHMECFNFDTYRWAAWNVHSRALTLRGVKYLIPLADMVNYQPLPDDGAQNRNHQDLFLKYHRITLNPHDQGTGIAEIFADRDFAVGSMIVESYGDNPNNMYLRYFGFVPLTNPTDCRTIRFSLQHAKGSREASTAALRQANLPTHVQHCFRLGEPVPSHVLRFLRILHANAHDAARAQTSAHLELSLRNEKAVYKTIVAECDALLAAFATTLEEDETWLAETGPPAASAAREMLNKRHAVLARVSEKRILKTLHKTAKRKGKQLKARAKVEKVKGDEQGGEVVFSNDEL